jgi:putative oxidoreductase
MVTTSVEVQQPRSRALLAALFSSRTAPLPADVALIAARATLGLIFVYHGARRLFGAFDGPGIHESAKFFADTAGLSPGTFFAVLSGTIEFAGGIAIALGLLTRLAGLAIFGDMMMAIITVTWSDGINATGGKSGYELNLALGVLALVVGIFGAGRVSVDALIERRLAAAAPPSSG